MTAMATPGTSASFMSWEITRSNSGIWLAEAAQRVDGTRGSRATPAAARAPSRRNARRRMSVLVHALADFSTQAPGLHILREQRTGPVLFPETAVQVLEDAQAGGEPDQVHELE